MICSFNFFFSLILEMGLCVFNFLQVFLVITFLCLLKLSMYNKTRNRGLAFVTMGSPEEALEAFNNLEAYVSILHWNNAIKLHFCVNEVENDPSADANL